MKNDDDKCFLYCYIRKFKNIVTNNLSRISKKDLLIAEEITDEYNTDFENVSLDKLDEIENLLEVNVHIFGCNKKFNKKKIIRKSKSDFDKDLDLLLIDDIKHYILIKNINKFISVIISVKNQQIKTNTIIKNNVEFLNDRRYISDVYENIPHTLYIE